MLYSFVIGENSQQIAVGGENSKTTLQFRVPKQQSIDANDVKSNQEDEPQKAELWLFPRIGQINEPNDLRWYELRLGFVFDVLKKEWEDEEIIYWRNSDECIMVDLTAHVQKIHRRLGRKKKKNETLASVKVTVHHKRELLQNIPTKPQDWQQICSSELQNRTSNTSFIVVQYFSNSADSSNESRRKKRTAVNKPLNPSNKIDSVNAHRRRAQRAAAVQRPSEEQGCTNYEYNVNLQEVFGAWVVAPTEEIDVGICYGFCDIGTNPEAFSPRGILRNRLRNMEESLVPSDHFDVSCTPLTFEPLILLIRMEETDTLILMDFPIKVKSCGCQ